MTQPLDPTLWEPDLSEKAEPVEETPEDGEIASVLLAADDTMPLVLVEVESTPRQLQSIVCGDEQHVTIRLDDEGKVELRGRETIWAPELVLDAAPAVESFDSGVPVAPVVELQKQDRISSDA